MMIDGILLLRLRSLQEKYGQILFLNMVEGKLTGVSIHVRNCVSNAAHPATLYPDDAQHAVIMLAEYIKILRECILNTELMSARHGLASDWFGLRTRNFGRGGKRIGVRAVVPLGGMLTEA